MGYWMFKVCCEVVKVVGVVVVFVYSNWLGVVWGVVMVIVVDFDEFVL